MIKKAEHNHKAKTYALRLYDIILVLTLVVLLSQIPACVIVFLDDAGQIDYTAHESIIKYSTTIFAFPLRLFVSTQSVNGLLIFIANIFLLSVLAFLTLVVRRRLNNSLKATTSNQLM